MIPLTPDTKTIVALVEEAKPSLTFDQMDETFDGADGTWNNPGTPVSLEGKNTVTLTNEPKL